MAVGLLFSASSGVSTLALGRVVRGGRGHCRVAAFWVFSGSVLADFFSAVSHCAWQHFISLSNSDKETKQRKRLATDGT
jgi:hypothetical protein